MGSASYGHRSQDVDPLASGESDYLPPNAPGGVGGSKLTIGVTSFTSLETGSPAIVKADLHSMC